jgi:hypothetical protein
MAGKAKIVRGALEGLADLFEFPKVKKAMVDEVMKEPDFDDLYELRDPGNIDKSYEDIFRAPGSAETELSDFGDEFIEELASFVKRGKPPASPEAKAMIESLYDSGLQDVEVKFFFDRILHQEAKRRSEFGLFRWKPDDPAPN